MHSQTQNAPRRHHYIPEFLLRALTGGDGLLERFRPTQRGVTHRRLAPRAVCFERDLYETTGLSPEHAQQMETLFFSPLDDGAAEAHARMLADGADGLHERTREAWTLFVMSLWFRTPQDIEALWGRVSALADAATRRALAGGRPEDVLPPVALKQLQMEAVRLLTGDQRRGAALRGMKWSIVDVTGPTELLISDWPIRLPADPPWLGGAASFVAVPLSPRRLFVAAGLDGLDEVDGDGDSEEAARRQNTATVGHARGFAGATDARPLAFVAETLGTLPRPSVFR